MFPRKKDHRRQRYRRLAHANLIVETCKHRPLPKFEDHENGKNLTFLFSLQSGCQRPGAT